MDLSGIGKLLIALGGLVVLAGVLFLLVGKGVIPRLPGDLSFGRGNVRVFIPIGTSIVLSILLTIVLNLFLRR